MRLALSTRSRHTCAQAEAIRGRSEAEAIRGNQRSSEAIRGHQRAVGGSQRAATAHRKPFEGDHQGSSEAIRGHQWSSGPIGNRSKAIIRVHQWSSGVIGNRSKVISGPSSSAQSSSAYLPSEGLKLFMKGVIRGHQGPSRSSAYLPSEGLKLFMKGPHHRR